MKTIWKFKISWYGNDILIIPKEAKILHVNSQNEVPCIWVLVDPNVEKEERSFCVVGTGHRIEDIENKKYLGTWMQESNSLVFHLFEIIK